VSAAPDSCFHRNVTSDVAAPPAANSSRPANATRAVEVQRCLGGVDGDEDEDEQRSGDRRGDRSPSCRRIAQPSGRLVFGVRVAESGVRSRDSEPRQHAEPAESSEGRPGVDIAPQMDCRGQRSQGEALRERGQQRRHAERGRPAGGRRRLGRHLDTHSAHDEGEQHHDHRQVSVRQDRAEGQGEARPEGDAEQDEPGLVAVPAHRDRLQHVPPVRGVAFEEGRHTDAEVVAVQHDVHQKADEYGRRPQGGGHRAATSLDTVFSVRRLRPVSGRSFGEGSCPGPSRSGPMRMVRTM